MKDYPIQLVLVQVNHLLLHILYIEQHIPAHLFEAEQFVLMDLL